MIYKIILIPAGKFVLYKLLFAFLVLFAFLISLNFCYGQETGSKQVQSFLEKNLAEKMPADTNKILNSPSPSSIPGDSIPFKIIKNDQQGITRYLISGTFQVNGNSTSLSLDDSLVLNYKKWNISPNNRISYTADSILATDFILSNDSAQISATNGKNLAAGTINIIIRNVDIRDITGIFSQDTLVATGLLNAEILASEFDKQLPSFTGTASIANFEIMQQAVGNPRLTMQKADDNTIHATFDLAENDNVINAKGDFFLNDDQRQFDLSLDIKKLQMALLQEFTRKKIGGASGSINGVIGLSGKFKNPEWKGALNFDTARFILSQFGTRYSIDKQKILLDYPAISFDRFTIKDSMDHPLVINGYLCSKTLTEYDLFLNLKSNYFSFLNAPKAINNQIYGNAGIDANISITGTTLKPVFAGDISLNNKTDVTLVLPEKNNDRDAARSAVRFIDRDIHSLPEKETFKPAADTGVNYARYLNYSLNISAKNEASLTIVIDPTTGDELKVKGITKLNPGIAPGGKMIMGGTYRLDSGYYELNYEFLQKRFYLIKGSTIDFDGIPTAAKINISAEYIANTSPKDLLGNEVGSVDPGIARSFNQKIPFRVILFLKGSLIKPEISFDILLPDGGEINNRLRNTIENKLVQLRADVAATNKQVFALLALDRFVGEQSTDFFKGNGEDFSTITRESVSKFLSAALDQIASDLFTGINIDLNLNSYKDFATSDESKKTDLNVEVSKNFLNDRLNVTVGKDFGIESQDGSTKASQQKASRFLPDVTVNYKLSTDGKYMIRSYKKNPFEVVMDGYVVESGLAFIVTLDYDLFGQLFMRKDKKTGQ